MTYRSYLIASVILAVGASLVYAAPRSAHVRKEAPKNVAPQEDAAAILEAFMRDVTQEVTEDGMLMLAGVIGVETASDGSMHVEVTYGGDFDRDMVLTIPRPVVFDSNGELIGVRTADAIEVHEDHVVFVFDPADEEKRVGISAKAQIFGPEAQDECERFADPETNKQFCAEVGDGCNTITKPVCRSDIDEAGRLTCNCQKEVEQQ